MERLAMLRGLYVAILKVYVRRTVNDYRGNSCEFEMASRYSGSEFPKSPSLATGEPRRRGRRKYYLHERLADLVPTTKRSKILPVWTVLSALKIWWAARTDRDSFREH
jgi:hypothetical protein